MKLNKQEIDEIINRIDQAVDDVNNDISHLPTELLVSSIDGMNTNSIRNLLNKIAFVVADYPGEKQRSNYLEVGVWKGGAFCSVLYNNSIDGYAIDSFKHFMHDSRPDVIPDTQKVGHSKDKDIIKQIFSENIKKLSKIDTKFKKVRLCHNNCFMISLKTFPLIDMYFYDGNHSTKAQEMAFTYYNSVLDDYFIAIVDDWEDGIIGGASRGTKIGFAMLKYKVIKDWSFPVNQGYSDMWWRGFYVALVKKP